MTEVVSYWDTIMNIPPANCLMTLGLMSCTELRCPSSRLSVFRNLFWHISHSSSCSSCLCSLKLWGLKNSALHMPHLTRWIWLKWLFSSAVEANFLLHSVHCSVLWTFLVCSSSSLKVPSQWLQPCDAVMCMDRPLLFLQSFPQRVQGTFSTFAFFEGTLFSSLLRTSTNGLFRVLVVGLRVLDIWGRKRVSQGFTWERDTLHKTDTL